MGELGSSLDFHSFSFQIMHHVLSLTVSSGVEIWRIEDFSPVLVPQSSHGKFFTRYSYVILKKNDQGEELLFVSSKAIFEPPKAIHGGIPICFPQFSNVGTLEQHGFARTRLRTIDSDPPLLPTNSTSKAFVNLIVKPSEDLKIWPHREVGVEGLETLDYLDNLQNRERCTEQGDAITFEGEVDKIYRSTPTKIASIDHEKKRTFVMRKDGLPDAVAWNPWDKKAKSMIDFGDEEYKYMLCVESAVIEKSITLKPGEEWKGRRELSAAPSS